MDDFQHAILSFFKDQAEKNKSLISKIDDLTSLMKESIAVQREQLNFFVALDRREMGMDDSNSSEYLAELRKDGFNPKSG